MLVHLSPGCSALLLPWGADGGVCASVRADAGPSGERESSLVREGPALPGGRGYVWRRADPWPSAFGPPGCPVRPYGPSLHLAAALRGLSLALGPGSPPWAALVGLASVLAQEGLREALAVMES